MLWPQGVKGHRTQSVLSLELDNDFVFAYLSQSFSRIHWITSDTRASQPSLSVVISWTNETDIHHFFSTILSCIFITTLLVSYPPNDLFHLPPFHFHMLPDLHLYSAHLFILFFPPVFICVQALWSQGMPNHSEPQALNKNKHLCFTWTAFPRGHSETKRQLAFSPFLSGPPPLQLHSLLAPWVIEKKQAPRAFNRPNAS